MPLSNPFATPDEVRAAFDQELAEARQSGKLPEFFTYALRKEILLRSEVVQLLVTKLADWLVQETELREKVDAIDGRQAGAIGKLTDLMPVLLKAIEERAELKRGLEEVTALLGNSQVSIADWHRRHATEHREIMLAIRTQSLLSQRRHTELAGAVSELSGLVGEALGRIHTQSGESTSQAMKLDKLTKDHEDAKEEVTGVTHKVAVIEKDVAKVQYALAKKLGKIGGYGGAGYIVFRIIELIITFLAKG